MRPGRGDLPAARGQVLADTGGINTGGKHRIALRHQRLGTVGLRDTDVADDSTARKDEAYLQSDDQFRNGFSGGSWGRSASPAQPPGNHPFPRASPGQPRRPRLLPSHTFCVGMLDLASVSTSVRSISNSVRRTHPTVSANLRRKLPLIARRAVHHCAPLHVVPATAADRERQIAQLVKDDEIDADEQVGHLAGLAGAALRPRAG